MLLKFLKTAQKVRKSCVYKSIVSHPNTSCFACYPLLHSSPGTIRFFAMQLVGSSAIDHYSLKRLQVKVQSVQRIICINLTQTLVAFSTFFSKCPQI